MKTKSKIAAIALVSYSLCFLLNPLNGIMRESLTGPLQIYVKIGPSILIIIARCVFLSLAMGAPIFFVGPLCGRHPFLEAGSFFGVLSVVACVLNFMVYQKPTIELEAWFMIVPIFAVFYFVLGFVSGGFWGLLGKRYYYKVSRLGPPQGQLCL